jgi:uncharacterized membrane protein YkvA (DUF1232 family)
MAVSKEDAKKMVQDGAKKVKEEDVRKALNKMDEIEETVRESGPLSRFIRDVKLMGAIIKDYAGGEYREVPWWSIAAITAALLYVINPIDIIPDPIPFVGYLDDAAVIAACLKMVEQDLYNYEKWKNN